MLKLKIIDLIFKFHLVLYVYKINNGERGNKSYHADKHSIILFRPDIFNPTSANEAFNWCQSNILKIVLFLQVKDITLQFAEMDLSLLQPYKYRILCHIYDPKHTH